MFAPSLKNHLGRLTDRRKVYDPWEGKVGVEVLRPGKAWEDFLSSSSRSAMGDLVVRTGIEAQMANSLGGMVVGAKVAATEEDDDAPKLRFRAPRKAKRGSSAANTLDPDALARIIRSNVESVDAADFISGGEEEWNRLKLGLATLQMTDWCDGLVEQDGAKTIFGVANRLKFLGWVGKSVTHAGKTEYFSLEAFDQLKDTRPELAAAIAKNQAGVVEFDGPLRDADGVVWLPEGTKEEPVPFGGTTLSDAFAELVLNALDDTEAFARQVVEVIASDLQGTSFGTAGTSAG